jgi:hypothetical protein
MLTGHCRAILRGQSGRVNFTAKGRTQVIVVNFTPHEQCRSIHGEAGK